MKPGFETVRYIKTFAGILTLRGFFSVSTMPKSKIEKIWDHFNLKIIVTCTHEKIIYRQLRTLINAQTLSALTIQDEILFNLPDMYNCIMFDILKNQSKES